MEITLVNLIFCDISRFPLFQQQGTRSIPSTIHRNVHFRSKKKNHKIIQHQLLECFFSVYSPRSCSEIQPLSLKGNQQPVKKKKKGEDTSQQNLMFLFYPNCTLFSPFLEERTRRKPFRFLYQFGKGVYFQSWFYKLRTSSINIAANCKKK